MPIKNPFLRFECTPELLGELHAAHEALKRAQVRAKVPQGAPALERLIVAIHGARNRVAKPFTLDPPESAPNANEPG